MSTVNQDEIVNIIVHYSEVGLKGNNRGFFEHRLKDNILIAMDDLKAIRLKIDFGRFIITVFDTSKLEAVIERMKRIIGIATFSVCHPGSTDVYELQQQVFDKMKDMQFNSFKIDTRRADKEYPLTSVEVNKIVGEKIFMELHKKVDLKNPELTCGIEIFNKKVYYSIEKHKGTRGLPVGSSGKVVAMLSSGIDSPVAAYRMMTRGCKVIFVHFHSFPFTEKTSYYNTQALAHKLTEWQYNSVVYFVPLAKIQQAIILNVSAKLRIIMYRRMMYRIAEKIARREHAKALVTGESVGQVASQTLENIIAISEVVTLPVFRPLIGSDKEEIIEMAQKLDTFKTSIEPYDDCCSYLLPKSPETRAKLDEVHEAENLIADWPELIKEAMREAEVENMYYPHKIK